MDQIQWRFSEKFRSQWIKVKFYKEAPKNGKYVKLKNVRFCQAVSMAVTQSILLDKRSVSCPGALYAFGWSDATKGLLKTCEEVQGTHSSTRGIVFSKLPRLNGSFKYIGLNNEGTPDVLLSYASPETAMNLVRQAHWQGGKPLQVSFSGVMPICGGVAVKAYLDGGMTFSFGCIELQKSAGRERNLVAVAVPGRMFDVLMRAD